MQRSTSDRILTTHTGSLPRAQDLLALLVAKDAHQDYDRATFETRVREEVDRVVGEQIAAGIDVVNDGEQGKISFTGYRYDRLSGFEFVDPASLGVGGGGGAVGEMADFPEFFQHLWQWGGGGQSGPPPPGILACTQEIGWKDFSEVERDIENLRAATSHVDPTEVFMTSISPATYAPPNLHYDTEASYLDALADAMAREYAAIVDAGFVLQIDAPDLTTLYRLNAITLEQHHEALDLRVAAINRAVDGLDPERIRVHVCWGADEAPHHLDVPLKDIVRSLLKLRANGLVIPGANGRHSHEWRVWSDVGFPDEKVLVAGVIDSTTNIIEHPEAVAERLARYASVVGPERVMGGVDCGFGTVAVVGQVDPRVMWAKFGSLAEGAALAPTYRL